MKEKLDPSDEVGVNKVGWYCLRHKDGWFVGTEDGVTCYRQHDIARAALTIAIERERGRWNTYRIETFRTGALVKKGEHTPELSAAQALKNLEGK